MALDKLTYAAAKKYTDNSIAGGGAVRGKNCVVTDISPITGGNRVTFQWTLDNGTVQQGTMDVMDGVDGQDGATGAQGPQGPAGADGLGIKSVSVNASGHLIITYDDDTTEDAGEIHVTAAVDSVNGQTGDVILTASDVGALPDDTTIPSKISDLTNDSDFIETSATAGLIKNDGTIDTKIYVEAEAGKGLSTNDYDNTAKAAVDGLSTALDGKVDKETGKSLIDLTTVVDGASYDSTNHQILFKNGTTTLFSLDAAAFVKDGMVDTVTITGGNLVITFNTDAGKQAISIPITDIFDPANYYDKTATDNLLADKADKTSVIQFKTTTETDANNLLEENGYYIVNTSDMTNLPTTDVSMGYCLEVIRYGSFSNALVVQIAYRGNPTTESPMYMRRNFNNVWTDWVAIAKKSEVTVKADKVSGATNGNFAGLDANGNLTDSGKKAADFATPTDVSNLENRSARLLKDTVGWTGKNLLAAKIGDTYSYNGVSFVTNNDGTVTANGTASGNAFFSIWGRTSRIPIAVLGIGNTYILSGDPNVSPDNKSYIYINYYDANNNRLRTDGSGNNGFVEFTIPAQVNETDVKSFDVGVGILTGKVASNYTFYPMLRRADIEDDTYESHHESVDNALIDKEVYRGRNLLPLIKYSQTNAGVTFTVYEDGTIHTSGTSTGSVWFNICGGPNESVGFMKSLIPGNKYIYSGMPSNAPSGVDMTIWDTIDLCPRLDKDHLEQEFTVPAADYVYGARTNLSIGTGTSGVNFNGLVFKPSIRRADEVNSIFEPYHLTMNTAKVDRDVLKEVGAYNLADPDLATTAQSGFTLTRSTYKGKGVQYKLTGADTGESGCQFIIEDDAKFLAKMKQFTGKLLKLTGCPRVGADYTNGFFLAMYFNYDQGAGATVSFMDYGDGAIIRVPTSITSARLAITVRHNAAPSDNETYFRPMVTPDLNAKFEDYVPYALTNQELTEVKTINGTATNTTNNATAATCVVAKTGRVCQFIFGFTLTAAVNVGSNISFTISGLPKPKGTTFIVGFASSSLFVGQFASDMSLTIRVLASNAANGYSIISGSTYITEE